MVTLARATLACGVAALVADAFTRPTPVTTLVVIASVALVLDWVDGRVARRTGTVSAFGARFDLEVDAFLILVLAVDAARDFGPWVLVIGLASYALLAARRLLPWLDRPAPPRHWCKVVAAIQGIVLTVAAAGVLPHAVTTALLAVALVLLAESFGREVIWLWRTRDAEQARARADVEPRGMRPGSDLPRRDLTVLAALLVWVALTTPNRLFELHPAAFLRLPVEAARLRRARAGSSPRAPGRRWPSSPGWSSAS